MPDPSRLPLSSTFPLAGEPYFSRINSDEIIRPLAEGGSKNYKLVAFRPGVALQASELNEIQENFAMQMTLTMNMYHNWITSAVPNYWGTLVHPNTLSVGDGGSGNVAVSAPGWIGTTPLHPFESPYSTGAFSTLVDVSVANNLTTVNIQFRKGWYLGEIVGDENADGTGDNEDITGLKYWIYLNAEEGESRFSLANIPLNNPDTIYVGLKITRSTINATEDNGLYDDSGGNGSPSTGILGANRIKYNFELADYAPTLDESVEISKVLKINSEERTIRYMNNLLITEF